MIFKKTLSPYRLKVKAVTTNKEFKTSNGLKFSVLISNESKKISQFYVVKSGWDKTNDFSKKITPLAHIHMSNSTGNIKVVLYQPDIWNISNKSKELVSFIKSISSTTETTLVH